MKLKRKQPRQSKLIGAIALASILTSFAVATGYACDPPPTQCDDDIENFDDQFCDGLNRWTIQGPSTGYWWGCSGSENCSLAGGSPPSGQCNVMTVTAYQTYLLTCNGQTRACTVGNGTPQPSPNRTCDNTPCNSGASTMIPNLIPDVCSNPWYGAGNLYVCPTGASGTGN